MSKAQWTVTGLLILLLGLEVVRSPNVKNFFTGGFAAFQTSLGGSATTGGGSTSSPSGSSTTKVPVDSGNVASNAYPATLPSSVRNVKGQVP